MKVPQFAAIFIDSNIKHIGGPVYQDEYGHTIEEQ